MKHFNVGGMSCAACSARVEKAVSALSGVRECSVNLLTNSMSVEGEASSEEIISAVVAAGYTADEKGSKKPKNDNNNLQNSAQRGILTRLIVSLALLVPLMYLSMGYVMWGAPLPAFLSKNPLAVAIVQMLLCAAVMVINQRFFISGAKGLINRSPNMDTLVSVGSGASFIYSVAVVLLMSASYVSGNTQEAVHYLHELYFESAAMILALITVGKLLEARAKGKTTDAIKGLLSLSPKTATVIRDGRETVIEAELVRVGDVFLVRPGESVPVDGVVLEGDSQLNEAALTGESMPKDKTVGDRVLAGTVNGAGFLRCEALKVGEQTTISAVIRMVEEASASKAPIAKIADRVAGVFVPAVMGIAALTLVLWWIFGPSFGYALARGISVLVISCPCALGLATPVAIMVGSGVGAKLGILYKSAEAIELCGKADVVALDKTGTVTRGEPKVVEVVAAEGASESELLSVAYSLEKMSEHPLAHAVTEYAEGRAECLDVSEFVAVAGSGVEGYINGIKAVGARLGYVAQQMSVDRDTELVCRRLSADGKTPLVFAKGDKVLGVIAVADTVREDSAAAISELRSLGLEVVMLTGDNRLVAESVGREAGVDRVVAELLPDGKAEAIAELAASGRVIMVGDGINDAPALMRADVGMAIGGGTDIAIDSADVVLMNSSLASVAEAVRLGRATYRNVCQNLFWAFIYNGVGIPLAAGAFIGLLGWELSPMFGALAMSLSSFSVVMNALRLGGFYKRAQARREKEKTEITELPSEKTEEKSKMTVKLKIEGMMCPHCEARVKKCLLEQAGVVSAEVSHKSGEAVLVCDEAFNAEAAVAAVTEAGYPAAAE